MSIRGTCAVALLFAALAMTPTPSLAQNVDTGALLDRIERLERDIRTLNVQIARGAGAAEGAAGAADGDPAYARNSVRISALESELRAVTGRLEELGFQINQMTERLEKLASDVDFRLNQLERGGAVSSAPGTPGASAAASAAPSGAPSAAAPTGSNQLPPGSRVLGTIPQSEAESAARAAAQQGTAPEPQSEADALLAQLTGEGPPITGANPDGGVVTTPESASAPAPAAAPPAGNVAVSESAQPTATTQTAALPDGTPREKYMHAFGLLRQGKYDTAASALQQFLEQHGDDALAGNARYWLGETFYVRGAYVEAAETFLEGYQTDPQGAKAPDALLKLGMSLASLDKKTEACAAFQKLRTDYPDASAGLKSTLQREWQRNGCV